MSCYMSHSLLYFESYCLGCWFIVFRTLSHHLIFNPISIMFRCAEGWNEPRRVCSVYCVRHGFPGRLPLPGRHLWRHQVSKQQQHAGGACAGWRNWCLNVLSVWLMNATSTLKSWVCFWMKCALILFTGVCWSLTGAVCPTSAPSPWHCTAWVTSRAAFASTAATWPICLWSCERPSKRSQQRKCQIHVSKTYCLTVLRQAHFSKHSLPDFFCTV